MQATGCVLNRVFIIFLLIVLFIYSPNSYSLPSKTVISGQVTDKQSGAALHGALISIELLQLKSLSDSTGYYCLKNIPPGKYKLSVVYLGYKPVERTILISKTVNKFVFNFQLEESITEIAGVVVKPKTSSSDNEFIISNTQLKNADLKYTPGSLDDILRAVTILPGFTRAESSRNDLMIRGGAPAENLFVLDGFLLPTLSHYSGLGAAGGSSSFINMEFVNNINFFSGAFPTRFGDKLSSVLDINLREPDKESVNNRVVLSASQMGINSEGPVSNNVNYILSLRRSFLDFIFKASGFIFVPEYYDGMAEINLRTQRNDKFSLLLLGAYDNVKFFDKSHDTKYDNPLAIGSYQKNYTAGISYKHWYPKGVIQFNLSRNYREYKTIPNKIFDNNSQEIENIFSSTISYSYSSENELFFGLTAQTINPTYKISMHPFYTSFGDTLPNSKINSNSHFLKYALFLEHKREIFTNIFLHYGFRLDYFDVLKSEYSFSPRFSARYMASDKFTVNLSAGQFFQYPSYIWLAAAKQNSHLLPLKMEQLIAGVEYKMKESFTISLEAFSKYYSNYPASKSKPYLVMANTGGVFSGTSDNFDSFGLEALNSAGKGKAEGMEFMIRKANTGELYFGILNVSLAAVNFSGNDGIKHPGNFDQRWNINFVSGFNFSETWNTIIKFRYSSGKPYTPFSAQGIQDVSKYNAVRFPDFHAIDVRIAKKWISQWLILESYLDIQNIYNKKIHDFIIWDGKTNQMANYPVLGILPTIGISVQL